MATKKDKTTLAAQKARKQKIIAIAGGVVLLGLAAIQGPKLLKQLNPPAPKQAAAAVTPAAPTSPAAAAAPSGAPAVPAGRYTSTAVLAGVTLPGGTLVAHAEDGKLTSFSLFEPKDPFVPQVSDTPAAPTPPAAGTAAGGSPFAPGTPTTPAAGNVGTAPADTPAVAPAKPAFATIEVNGKAQQLTLKDVFPKDTPTFVLVALTRSAAKIGVAGGAFSSGKTLPLKLGKQVTLVDTATGVRYALKLVYAGAEPEQTEGFTSAPPANAPAQPKKP